MSKSSLKVAPALKPRSSRSVPVSPCVLYKLHEGAGGTVVDSYGNGPALTLAASGTGTPWSDKGWLTPDGTNHYINIATSAYLQSLLRFDQDWAQMLIAFDYQFTGDTTTIEAFLSLGRNDSGGTFTIMQSTAEQLQIQMRGKGSSSASTYSIAASALTSFGAQRLTMLFELVKTGANTFDTNVYKNGAAFASHTGADWSLNGATAPWGDTEATGYTIGARNNAAAIDYRIGAGTSAGKYGRFLVMRRATRDAQLAADLALELYTFRGEKPICLNGK